jgi:hypothetical protein
MTSSGCSLQLFVDLKRIAFTYRISIELSLAERKRTKMYNMNDMRWFNDPCDCEAYVNVTRTRATSSSGYLLTEPRRLGVSDSEQAS